MVLGLLFSVSANANLFGLKTYAKCEYEATYELSGVSLSYFYKKNYVKYFAFDKENFYYKYNIAKKDFDRQIAHEDGSDPVKYSNKFPSEDGTARLSLIFDGTTGELKVQQQTLGGSITFKCDKIRKNKLPKSKF